MWRSVKFKCGETSWSHSRSVKECWTSMSVWLEAHKETNKRIINHSNNKSSNGSSGSWFLLLFSRLLSFLRFWKFLSVNGYGYGYAYPSTFKWHSTKRIEIGLSFHSWFRLIEFHFVSLPSTQHTYTHSFTLAQTHTRIICKFLVRQFTSEFAKLHS